MTSDFKKLFTSPGKNYITLENKIKNAYQLGMLRLDDAMRHDAHWHTIPIQLVHPLMSVFFPSGGGGVDALRWMDWLTHESVEHFDLHFDHTLCTLSYHAWLCIYLFIYLFRRTTISTRHAVVILVEVLMTLLK